MSCKTEALLGFVKNAGREPEMVNHPHPMRKETNLKTGLSVYTCTKCRFWVVYDMSGSLVTTYKDRSDEPGKINKLSREGKL